MQTGKLVVALCILVLTFMICTGVAVAAFIISLEIEHVDVSMYKQQMVIVSQAYAAGAIFFWLAAFVFWRVHKSQLRILFKDETAAAAPHTD
jgi:glycerol-3-phosphate acyltransferase PlsY